jgi:hypothetical protein
MTCPYCPYTDPNGKQHDPLSTERDRRIHEETHQAAAEAAVDHCAGVISDIAKHNPLARGTAEVFLKRIGRWADRDIGDGVPWYE